jgi:hypothetical protein
MRNIQRITDRYGNMHENTTNILRTFTEHLKEKYEDIKVKTDEVEKLGQSIPKQLSHEANKALENLISMEELQTAIQSGKNREAPGRDGICQEFYKVQWNTIKYEMLGIIQQMHTDGEITPQQKHGILVCLPKTTIPTRPDEYRALTLLNADLKILARIMAQRLSSWLTDILHPSQHCGVNGKSILHAVSTVRDAIAFAETTNKELCILSLDFQVAFDNISHTYLYKILRAHGFDEKFQGQIKSMYEGTTASVQINGHISSPIPILCCIRQGCPLSMPLMHYA